MICALEMTLIPIVVSNCQEDREGFLSLAKSREEGVAALRRLDETTRGAKRQAKLWQFETEIGIKPKNARYSI